LYKFGMPLYEFKYVDDAGEAHYFEEWVSADDAGALAAMRSPCGNYEASRVFSAPPMRQGMTAAQKKAGTTKKRVEFADYAKEQRSQRKKESDPGSRARESNEFWVGNENFKGVLSAEPALNAGPKLPAS
jgi:hypothetical protein